MKFTENQMSSAFQDLLLLKREGIKQFPEFKFIFKEVQCQQGIADFICLSFTKNDMFERKYISKRIKNINSISNVLAQIKKNSPRTEEYIINKTGLSRKTVRNAINELQDIGIIINVNDKSYVLSSSFTLPKVDIWAFELKLKNWKRALFQALQYKAFANYVVNVFPWDKLNLIQTNLDIFKQLNVGVVIFDSATKKYCILNKPRKENPVSKMHVYYILGQLLSLFQRKGRIK